MSTRAWPPVFAALAALALALAVCGGGSEADRDAGDATSAGAGPAPTSVATAAPAGATAAPSTPTGATAAPSTPTATPPPTRAPIAGCPAGPSAPPATYYGFGLDEGVVVRTFNTRAGCENIVCEQSEVDVDGFWVVRIAGDNVCGVREGDEIVFTVNEEPTTHTERWLAGGVPADVANGISLER